MASARKSGVDTAILMIEILRRIPRGRSVTAQEIHEQLLASGLARNIRSIQRHLDDLSAHFSIERDERSRPYGYRWKEQTPGLAVPTLGPQESLLLRLAQQHMHALLPDRLNKAMAPFFEQAHRNLGPASDAALERAWLKKVRVVATNQPLLPPKIRPGVLETVSEALYQNQILEIDYENAAGKRTQTHVQPLGLAQQGSCLYLVCRYEGYDNERNLALHRILKAANTGQPFAYPKDFDLARYDAEGHFGFGEGEKVRLSFEIRKPAGRHLLEARLSEDQQVEEKGDWYAVSATVVDTAILDWWLNGFGRNVRKVVKVESR